MDLDTSLFYLSVTLTLAMLVRGLREVRAAGASWAGVALALGAVEALLALWGGNGYGTIAAGCVGVFLLAPLLLLGRASMHATRTEFALAERYARVGRVLHPFGWLRMAVDLYRALDLEQRGRVQEAGDALRPLSTRDSRMGRTARATLLRMEQRWLELSQWLATLPIATMCRETSLPMQLLRAYGEVGNTQALVDTAEIYEKAFDLDRRVRATSWLFLFAFSGRPAAVSLLLDGPLHAFPTELKSYWRARSVGIAS